MTRLPQYAARADAGFSLLELLVAVAVLSLAAVTMIEHQAGGARMTSRVQVQALAATVAENRLALLKTQDVAPRAGSKTGEEEQLGVTFRWREEVRVISGSDMLALNIVVSLENSEAPVATLTGFRRAE
ncbi:type II secretion system minor pseudopilin GspI [Kordiimonas sp.]|uniref:type II secretion system minor pseudopilin GspI n=1 Tax=Kordiimonas sp. TaxID=1970157 RepID=UPI003A93AA45